MRTRLRFTALLAAAEACIVGANASAALYVQPDLPDFFQHQKASAFVNVPGENVDFTHAAPQPPADQIPSYGPTPRWWESGSGWCCISAYVNALFSLETRFDFPGLFTRPDADGHPWQERMIFAIEDMANKVLGLTGPSISIPRYLSDLQAQAHRQGAPADLHLEFDAFTMDDTASLLEAYRAELCRGAAVLLFWSYPNGVPAGETAPWWSRTFHTTTGAGVDCNDPTSRTLSFADPDKRNADEAGIYLDVDVRDPYPIDPNLALPIGSLHYEQVTLDDAGCILSGIYRGACLAQLTEISVVPTPGTAWLLLGALAVGWVAMRASGGAAADRS